ncbi:oxidoreductase C-terminal domain-containing protein, partial [Pseudoalteromonas sp. S983]
NHGYDNTVLRQHSSNSFSLWYLKQGRIIAADCINTAKDFMAAKKIIDKKISLPIDMIGNTDIDLIKQLSGRSQAI